MTAFDSTGAPVNLAGGNAGTGNLVANSAGSDTGLINKLWNGATDYLGKAPGKLWDYGTSKEAAPLVGQVIAGYGKGQQLQTQHDWEMDTLARRNANLSAPIILAPYKPTSKLGG